MEFTDVLARGVVPQSITPSAAAKFTRNEMSGGALIRRLASIHTISAEEEANLLALFTRRCEVARGADIRHDNGLPIVNVVLRGLACRYEILPSGVRQILAFHYPGDITDLSHLSLGKLDHRTAALTPCVVASIRVKALQRLADVSPNIASAISRYCFVQASILQAWLINLGRRSAPSRLSHLLCEVVTALNSVCATGLRIPAELHLVQSDWADAVGLSAVHLNRTLQELRRRRLISSDPNTIEILDWQGLQRLGQFDPCYLHLLPSAPLGYPSRRRVPSKPDARVTHLLHHR